MYVCKSRLYGNTLSVAGLPAGVQANYDDDDDDDDDDEDEDEDEDDDDDDESDDDEDDDGDANEHGMVTRSMGREVLYLM